MSQSDLLNLAESLPSSDKAFLLKTLVDALIKENITLTEQNAVWSLRTSSEAAQTLQALLDSHKVSAS